MAYDADLTIIGLGSAGIAAAEIAAELDLRVVVVEKAQPGGDCLWTGCVPSKSLIAAGRVARRIATADRYGLASSEPDVDLGQVWKRIDEVRQSISEAEDSPEHFAQAGIELIEGTATITSPHEVTVDGARRVSTRYTLVTTGSRPAIPPIEGLAEAGYLTTDDLWDLSEPPESLVVIGGGPIALETSQALTRLGVRATVIEMADRFLAADEPELVDRLVEVLRSEGVDLRSSARVESVSRSGGYKTVTASTAAGPEGFEADDVLVAAGRAPLAAGLGLEGLGVEVGSDGIRVDDRMRTSVPSVYAAGDVVGGAHFTHAAAYEAATAVRDMFFPGRGRAKALVPWVTYTDPELAHVGMTSEQAEAEYGSKARVWTKDLASSDRARADGETDGSLMLVTAGRRIVGGHFLGPAAGELANETLLAIETGVSVHKFAMMVRAYPTYSTDLGLLAAEASRESLRKLRWLVKKN